MRAQVRVKICGVRDAAALAAAAEAGADFVGLVFFPRSPRAVSVEAAATLAVTRPAGGPALVGLFVDPADDDLSAVLRKVPLDWIQLHGHEPPDRVAEIRQRFGLPVLKAVGVASRAEAEAAVVSYAPVADALLFDAKPPPGATRPGGNAVALDAAMLAGLACPRLWLLAGGLAPDTVAEAIRACAAPGVDVSSGVERAPGEKDPARIRAFVAAARAA
ncbi:MAG: phosphoribosylanthranilate isomerase [Acetobacteraceae bacterium]|nr:phosphoribosylanthranilate isomerase [Acetobacteraceae bacterium]